MILVSWLILSSSWWWTFWIFGWCVGYGTFVLLFIYWCVTFYLFLFVRCVIRCLLSWWSCCVVIWMNKLNVLWLKLSCGFINRIIVRFVIFWFDWFIGWILSVVWYCTLMIWFLWVVLSFLRLSTFGWIIMIVTMRFMWVLLILKWSGIVWVVSFCYSGGSIRVLVMLFMRISVKCMWCIVKTCLFAVWIWWFIKVIWFLISFWCEWGLFSKFMSTLGWKSKLSGKSCIFVWLSGCGILVELVWIWFSFLSTRCCWSLGYWRCVLRCF